MSKEVQKVVKTKAEEARVAKTKGRREEVRREGVEKIKNKKNQRKKG